MVHVPHYGEIEAPPLDLERTFRGVEAYFGAGLILRRGAAVVDVGASIGALAIAAAKRCEGEVEAWCYEPVPALYAALEHNLWKNDWLAGGKHRALNAAISGSRRGLTLADAVENAAVPRIDLLRLDVGNSTVEVLANARRSMWSRVDQIVIEAEDDAVRLRAVLAIVLAQGFGRLCILGPSMRRRRGVVVIAARPAD